MTFLIFALSSCLGAAAEIHVSAGSSIQAAVNSAHSGDTIIVDPGTYNESIYINKTNDLNNLVLTSSTGDPTTTIITPKAGSKDAGVISITNYKTNVIVRGLTIKGATTGMAGIYLNHAKQCTIENNIFTDDHYGVYIYAGTPTDNHIIRNNIISRTGRGVNDTVGINIIGSGNALVSQNKITNQFLGIHITDSVSKGSQILDNTINNNGKFGIFAENVKGVTFKGNTLISSDLMGINLAASSENIVTNNIVEMSSTSSSAGAFTQGIQLIYVGETSPVGSDSNIVSNNIIKGAAHGYFSNSCKNNTIINNTVSDCNYGIAMRYSHNNRIINNTATGNRNGINGEGIFLTYEDSGNTVSGNTANECIGSGIHLNENCGANNIVDSNTVNNNQFYGIRVEAPNNKITNNVASGNSRGIYLTSSRCHDNTVFRNTLTQNSGTGIYLMNTSADNNISSNTLMNNNMGINLFNSNNSYVGSNYLQENDNQGIQAENSSYVKINNNTAFSNGIGIRLHNTENSTVSRNNATASTQSDIDLNSAINNTITGNLITWSEGPGLSMCPACRNNLIYDNYFYNGNNANVKNDDNTFYIPRTPGRNVVKGPFIGGNFWASPGEDGFSQTASDTNGDGIADTQYVVTSSDGTTRLIYDMYPLVSVVVPIPDFSMSTTQGTAPLSVQFTDKSQNADLRKWSFGDGNTSTVLNPVNIYSKAGTYIVNLTASNKNDSISKLATVTVLAYVEPPVNPVADFNADQTSGNTPLTVKFTDASQNAAGWSWTFGDGGTSTEQSPTYIFNTAGTFNVILVVSNANGTSSKTVPITVSSIEDNGGSSHSSSSSGGSGGGGGAGGSPEPQNNVAIKELSQTSIFTGTPVKFEFPQKVTAVEAITFDSKKTVGKTTTIVEMLKNQSTLVSGAPSDEVYKYMNIWVGSGGYATEKNIENAAVTFKVEKSWVQDKKIDKSSITLYRYSDKAWNKLSTTFTGEDNTYLKYTAKTPGFSPFAITGKSTAIQPSSGDKTKPATVTQTQTNAGNASTANTNKTTAQNESPSPTQKQSPGFEVIIGVAGFVAVFLYRRK